METIDDTVIARLSTAQETTGGLLHMPCQEIFHAFLKVNSHIIYITSHGQLSC